MSPVALPPLAFVVLAHREFHQLERLVAWLAADAADTVVIHIDQKADQTAAGAFRDRASRRWSNVLFAPAVRCEWAGYSLVQATENCLDVLLRTGREFAWCTTLSGMDYPIKPIAALRRFLAAEAGREFIEAFDVDLAPFFIDGMAQERYAYRWPFPPGRYGAVVFKLWSMWQHLRDRRRLPPPGLQMIAGSQWWTLSRDGVDVVRQHLAVPALRAFHATTFVPDELVFPTAIMNTPLRASVTGHNLSEILWAASGTPHVLTEAHFDLLQSSARFFTRKCEPVASAALLDRIDSTLLAQLPQNGQPALRPSQRGSMG